MSPIEVPAKIQLVEKRETRTSRGMLSKGWYQVDDQLVMSRVTPSQRPEPLGMSRILR